MTSEELNTILGRGICYSKIEKAHRILVTGMNPSFRQGDPAREDFVCEYEYQGIVEEFPGNGSEYRVEILQRPERA